MAVTITEQLTKLNQLRQQLAANLTTKGVTATATEKFNTLVPKVLAISGGESPTTTVLYDATHLDKVSLLYNGTIYSVADFTALHFTYITFAAKSTLLHLPYIVRFTIFNLLFVPSTKPFESSQTSNPDSSAEC